MKYFEVKFNATSNEWFLDNLDEHFWTKLTNSQRKQLKSVAFHFDNRKWHERNKEKEIKKYEIFLRQCDSKFGTLWIEFKLMDANLVDVFCGNELQYGTISRRGKVEVLTHGKKFFSFI